MNTPLKNYSAYDISLSGSSKNISFIVIIGHH